jgi:hypothetical protein
MSPSNEPPRSHSAGEAAREILAWAWNGSGPRNAEVQHAAAIIQRHVEAEVSAVSTEILELQRLVQRMGKEIKRLKAKTETNTPTPSAEEAAREITKLGYAQFGTPAYEAKAAAIIARHLAAQTAGLREALEWYATADVGEYVAEGEGARARGALAAPAGKAGE